LRRQLAERMGATWVYNPLEVDIVEAVRDETNGDGVDVLLEMSGNAAALRQGLHALTQGGRVSLLGLFAGPVSLDLNTEARRRSLGLYCQAFQITGSLGNRAARLAGLPSARGEQVKDDQELGQGKRGQGSDVGRRELHGDRGAYARRALQMHRALVTVDNLLADGQAQTGAALPLGAVERLQSAL
jgi:hypothetical protein